MIQKDTKKSASNFAVKEAVSKVFGTGIRNFSLLDIEVLRDPLGKPYVNLYGAAKDIAKGEILTEDNITIKRPGNGVSPMKWDDVIGTVAIKDFKYDQLIEI